MNFFIYWGNNVEFARKIQIYQENRVKITQFFLAILIYALHYGLARCPPSLPQTHTHTGKIMATPLPQMLANINEFYLTILYFLGSFAFLFNFSLVPFTFIFKIRFQNPDPLLHIFNSDKEREWKLNVKEILIEVSPIYSNFEINSG